jgi:hypothetical protein
VPRASWKAGLARHLALEIGSAYELFFWRVTSDQEVLMANVHEHSAKFYATRIR